MSSHFVVFDNPRFTLIIKEETDMSKLWESIKRIGDVWFEAKQNDGL